MATAGSFRVGEGGAAAYEVPIRVPPGTAGMQPKLAFVYSHRGSNGSMGMGWGLSGLSAITRCPRTIAQNDAVGAINYDGNDRFCLDGQQLIVVNGGTYGAAGTEYRTERETFSKIISNGSQGNGPLWFQVRTRSGQIMEFGNTADSKVLALGQTSVRVFALNKISDQKGNELKVIYTDSSVTGDYYPSRIDYTGNPGAGLTPNLSVRFTYETRADVETAYIGGSLVRSEKRLTNAKTYVGETVIKDYRLAYNLSAATKRSRLASLTECVGDGSKCHPATTFQFQEGLTTLAAPDYSTPALPNTIAGGYYSRHSDPQFVMAGDFNGDGKTDYMWIPMNGDGRWLMVYATSTGFTTPNYNAPALPATLAGGYYTRHTDAQFMRLGDFNGDGRTDYMWIPTNSDGRWLIAYGTESGFTTPNYNTPALPAALSSGHYTRHSDHQFMFTGDFNGDGRADHMWIPLNGDARWLIAYSNGTGFTLPNYSTPALPATITGGYQTRHSDPEYVRFGDFNGDGQTDYMWIPLNGDGRWLIAHATGTGFAMPDYNTPALPNTITGGYYSRHSDPQYIITSDFNGDGKTDFMWIPMNGDGRWLIVYATGKGFTAPDYNSPVLPNTITGGYSNRHSDARFMRIGDFNGDGKTDYMWIPLNSDARWLIAHGTGTGFTLPDYNTPALAATITGGYYTRHVDTHFMMLGDFNGDGKTDFMWIPTNSDGRWLLAYHAGPFPDLVTSVDSGIGASTTVTYKPLTTTGYTKELTAVYPMMDYQGASYVVASYSQSNGIGGTLSVNYTYTGAKLDLHGRGFLGFHIVEGTDPLGIVQTTTYRQDWPYTGLPSQIKRVRQNNELTKTDTIYACKDFDSDPVLCTLIPKGKRYFVYPSQIDEIHYDMNLAFISRTRTLNTYGDLFGNATQVTVNHLNENGTPTGHTTVTDNIFGDNIPNWLLGRLTRSTVSSTTP